MQCTVGEYPEVPTLSTLESGLKIALTAITMAKLRRKLRVPVYLRVEHSNRGQCVSLTSEASIQR